MKRHNLVDVRAKKYHTQKAYTSEKSLTARNGVIKFDTNLGDRGCTCISEYRSAAFLFLDILCAAPRSHLSDLFRRPFQPSFGNGAESPKRKDVRQSAGQLSKHGEGKGREGDNKKGCWVVTLPTETNRPRLSVYWQKKTKSWYQLIL